MDTLTAIATRRSTRVYKPEQISDSQLQTVLAAGWASPVGHGAYDELYISVCRILRSSFRKPQIQSVLRRPYFNRHFS